MQGALSATLAGTETSWTDDRKLETGICSSYALIPTDRTGNPDYLKVASYTNRWSTWPNLRGCDRPRGVRFQGFHLLLSSITKPRAITCIKTGINATS